MTVTIPWGYGTSLKTLDEARALLLAHHHPEYVRRLMTWLTYKNGQIGVGGGWRADGTQPNLPGFAPEGKSFHQNQRYSDGFIGACAVDLVARNPGAVHKTVTWTEVLVQGGAEAVRWGLHCNVSTEPWHMQPIEIDGYQSWLNAGQPAPRPGYPIPTLEVPEVDWNPSAATVAAITQMPSVADTLAGKYNSWAVIGLIKAVQEMANLTVTGKADQATWLAVNEVLKA